MSVGPTSSQPTVPLPRDGSRARCAVCQLNAVNNKLRCKYSPLIEAAPLPRPRRCGWVGALLPHLLCSLCAYALHCRAALSTTLACLLCAQIVALRAGAGARPGQQPPPLSPPLAPTPLPSPCALPSGQRARQYARIHLRREFDTQKQTCAGQCIRIWIC